MEEKKKTLRVVYDFNMRKLLEEANELEISQEEIVDIKIFNDMWYLIYYR